MGTEISGSLEQHLDVLLSHDSGVDSVCVTAFDSCLVREVLFVCVWPIVRFGSELYRLRFFPSFFLSCKANTE